jgi:hypothetical protein
LPIFDGKGRPGDLAAGAFFTGVDFFAGAFLATFLATFFAGAFFAAFFATDFFAGAFFATFFAGAFLAGAFLAAFFATFFPGTPRTLCVFASVTNFATHGLDFACKTLQEICVDEAITFGACWKIHLNQGGVEPAECK